MHPPRGAQQLGCAHWSARRCRCQTAALQCRARGAVGGATRCPPCGGEGREGEGSRVGPTCLTQHKQTRNCARALAYCKTERNQPERQKQRKTALLTRKERSNEKNTNSAHLTSSPSPPAQMRVAGPKSRCALQRGGGAASSCIMKDAHTAAVEVRYGQDRPPAAPRSNSAISWVSPRRAEASTERSRGTVWLQLQQEGALPAALGRRSPPCDPNS